MRIGILSDTHSYLDSAIKKHFNNVDEIWHAGDIGNISITDELKTWKPLRAVYGNIDGTDIRKEFHENEIFHCEKMKVLMTHIGGKPYVYPERVRELHKIHQPNIYVCGHSHILRVQYDKRINCLYINPGAAGKHGFHKVQTIITMEINKDKVENMQVLEISKR